jgi:hypothetical protein
MSAESGAKCTQLFEHLPHGDDRRFVMPAKAQHASCVGRSLCRRCRRLAEKELVDLTLVIAAMNAFNHLRSPFHLPVAAKP